MADKEIKSTHPLEKCPVCTETFIKDFESEVDRERRAELTLLSQTEILSSQGAKKDFCIEAGIDWEEYLRIHRKWKHVIIRFQKEAQLEKCISDKI